MNSVMIARIIVGFTTIAAGVFLAYQGKEGWGWCLFIGFILAAVENVSTLTIGD